MSSIPLISGATHILKVTPNPALIPSTISSIDQLFALSLLSDTKYSNWLSAASSASKIGIIDASSGVECSRYIDYNFNASTPAGSIWFSGPVQSGNAFYLQAGPAVSKANQASVFVDHIVSLGFEEAAGEFIDRCGNYNGTGSLVTYNQAGVFGKSAQFTAANSKIDFGNISSILSIQKHTLIILIKYNAINDFDLTVSMGSGIWVDFYNGGVEGTIDATKFYASFDLAGKIAVGEWHLLTFVFDGSQTDVDLDIQDAKRFKSYLDGLEQPLVFDTYGGHVPALTYDTGPLQHYTLGNTGYSALFNIDEHRNLSRSLSEDENLWLNNIWMNQAGYWTVTVQPVISKINSLGSGKYEIVGTGLKPESTNPTGTINGITFSVVSATDTSVIVQEGSGTSNGIKTVILTNSGSLSDSSTFINMSSGTSLSLSWYI